MNTQLPSLTWLIENPAPGVRYLALSELSDLPSSAPELIAARRLAHREGPIATILESMHPDGYWSKPGAGYNPKYFSTVWAITLLAQLGASIQEDERLQRACDYLVSQALTPVGQFTASGAPSGTADCLQGNLSWALLKLGYEPGRLQMAFDWMARTVTGEGLASNQQRDAPLRYYAGKCGPCFACGANDKKPCAWGGVKVMLAFAALPPDLRSPLIQRAIQAGVEFFFSIDPATAAYPSGYASKPSGNWWKFGFPVFYVTDLLQLAEALVQLGYGRDARLQNTLSLIAGKQDSLGRWLMEYDYTAKTLVDFGPRKQPNPWVTLRALRVLRQAG